MSKKPNPQERRHRERLRELFAQAEAKRQADPSSAARLEVANSVSQTPWVESRPLRAGTISALPTTPSEPLSERVRHLCTAINPKAEPVFLPYTELDAGYRAGQCHCNVVHRIWQNGGERINGWMIWESNLFVEGEFHCVWKRTDGHLVDITPRRDGEQMILFLPDPHTRLEIGKHGGMMQPANRTTLPRMPFSLGGMPSHRPAAENLLNADTRNYMANLGVTLAALCQ